MYFFEETCLNEYPNDWVSKHNSEFSVDLLINCLLGKKYPCSHLVCQPPKSGNLGVILKYTWVLSLEASEVEIFPT